MTVAGEAITMLTVEQLAKRWCVNAKTIYAAIQAQQLRVLRIGRVIRVPVDVVEELESQGRAVPTGGPHVGATR